MMARFKYTNARLRAYIEQLPGKADRAVEEVAQKVQRDAQRRAPVDTGHLRSSITTRREGQAQRVVEVGADYGIYVEFGHRTRGGGGFVGPQPFFIPAIEAARGQFAASARAALQP